ncbi:MAG TPA: CRTAC1 family protein [Thermoanaerobaculia bacterium]
MPGHARARAAAFGVAFLALACPAAGELRFREAAERWGLAFRHHHGGSGRYYFAETNSGGVALFDYDGDGDNDVFFVDGGVLPGYAGEPPRSRLFRNDGGRFVDRTAGSGVAVAAYGMGAAAGDVDGDGDLDLYVTAFGRDQLFRNQGDGTFADVTAAAGLGDPEYSMSAAFADADRDGDLDLYLANYVDFTVETHKPCAGADGVRGYCSPGEYEGIPDRFYLNRGPDSSGQATFEEAGPRLGLPPDRGKGMGIVFADLDDDGWPDLYVANDTTPNFLFRNRGRDASGRPKFEDVSLVSGAAVSAEGRMEAGMGVDAGDYDGDGRLDLVVTNFAQETNALYRGLGGALFFDARFVSGIAEPSFPMLGFGVAFADLDQDGDLDLAVANGHVLDRPELFGSPSPYAQRNQVFENLGDGRFREVLDAGLDVVRVSRGLAAGDLDGDADLDLVVVNSNQPAEVYENLAGGRWLAVELVGRESNRFGIGARLELEAGGRRQVREARTASSYLSQNALTVHFGLPAAAAGVDRLLVRWPSGRRQRVEGLPAGRRLVLFE